MRKYYTLFLLFFSVVHLVGYQIPIDPTFIGDHQKKTRNIQCGQGKQSIGQKVLLEGRHVLPSLGAGPDGECREKSRAEAHGRERRDGKAEAVLSAWCSASPPGLSLFSIQKHCADLWHYIPLPFLCSSVPPCYSFSLFLHVFSFSFSCLPPICSDFSLPSLPLSSLFLFCLPALLFPFSFSFFLNYHMHFSKVDKNLYQQQHL